MNPFDLAQLAQALVLLHRANIRRKGGHTQAEAEEEDSEARALLHAILDRNDIELDTAKQLRLERIKHSRTRLISERECGFVDLP